ncbi:MAG: hypothetical protein ABSH49_29030 [Bryobacteraceae bacterium]|jgi:hypothetical protein
MAAPRLILSSDNLPQDVASSFRKAAIVVPHDELKRLEKRFGAGVWRMGSWNSDGVFGYTSIPILVVEEAVEGVNNPALTEALVGLKQSADQTKSFLELVETYGSDLIHSLVAIYRGGLGDNWGRKVT